MIHFTAFVIARAAMRAAPTLGKTHESVPGSTLLQPYTIRVTCSRIGDTDVLVGTPTWKGETAPPSSIRWTPDA
jgi:hypothetical protein